MANPVVDPKRQRVNVEFSTTGSSGGAANVYSCKMANSNTQGTLFTLMGYTDKGDKVTNGAIPITREQALENGLIIRMVADCKRGNRTMTREIYVPTNKLEETIKGAQGKTIGTLQVLKVRGARVRLLK